MSSPAPTPPGLVAPPGRKVTLTIEIWAESGDVRMHSDSTLDTVVLLVSLLSLCQKLSLDLHKANQMLVGQTTGAKS